MHADNLKLLVFKFGGRYFVELCLMFVVRSFLGILSILLALLIKSMVLMAGIPCFPCEITS